MIAARFRAQASVGVLLAALTLAAGAEAAAPAPSRFAGSYSSTHINGTRVARLELKLRPDGSLSLRTASSRNSLRPTAAEVGAPIVETGTWRTKGGQVVLHFDKTSEGTANDSPRFEDLAFQLVGCELRMVGQSRMVFDKHDCT